MSLELNAEMETIKCGYTLMENGLYKTSVDAFKSVKNMIGLIGVENLIKINFKENIKKLELMRKNGQIKEETYTDIISSYKQQLKYAVQAYEDLYKEISWQ